MAKDENRCWPGHEPVKGKKQHEQGNCRPKAKSKLTASETKFREKRIGQIDAWKKQHPGSPKKAAQHLHSPETKKAVTKHASKRSA